MPLPDLSFSASRGSITTYPILTQRMPKSRYQEDESVEDGTEYYERVSAGNPTGLLALVNEYDEVDSHEDEATVPKHYATI